MKSALSPLCLQFCNRILSEVETRSVFDSALGGVAGATMVYTKKGVVPVSELSVGDRLLTRSHGFISVVEIGIVGPGGSQNDISIELPSADSRSTGSTAMHPMQPVPVYHVRAARRIFGEGPVFLPAIWAGPFLGASIRTAEIQKFYQLKTDRAGLVWSVHNAFPCLTPDQNWEDELAAIKLSNAELVTWLHLFGFRLENYFRRTSIERFFPE